MNPLLLLDEDDMVCIHNDELTAQELNVIGAN